MLSQGKLRYVVGVLVAGWGGPTACSDACEDLAETCPQCADEDFRESCEGTVADAVQAVCSERDDFFTRACPVTVDGAGGGG